MQHIYYTIVDCDGNVIIIEGGTCQHCVAIMLLLNLNLVFEVISVEKEKKKRLREWRTIGSKTYMGGSLSLVLMRKCIWLDLGVHIN